jgi:hypothetical protein
MDKDKIWKEILDDAQIQTNLTVQQPDEMSIVEFAETSGMTKHYARTYLDKQVEDGKLELRILPGVRTRLYHPIHV